MTEEKKLSDYTPEEIAKAVKSCLKRQTYSKKRYQETREEQIAKVRLNQKKHKNDSKTPEQIIHTKQIGYKATQKWVAKNKERHETQQKQYRARTKDKRASYMKQYTTDKAKELQEYRKRTYEANRNEILAKNKKWKHDNPEKAKALRSQAKRNDRARRKGAEGSYTTKEFIAKCNEYNNCCAYCGAHEKLEPDHVVAISKGGTNYIGNIVPACHTCNVRKGSKSYEDFLEVLRSEVDETMVNKPKTPLS